MRVAIITAEYYEIAHFGTKRKEIPPFGILYLASVLEKMDIEVTLLQVSNEKFCFDLTNYDIICFSISSSIIYPIIKKVRLSSRINKDTILLAGGIHATVFPEDVISELKLDIVCIGEGENTIRSIINNLDSRHFSKIPGVLVYQNDKLVKTEPRLLIENLDEIPFPARHLLPEEDIVMTNRLSDTKLKVTHLLCSRGCPYNCYFCANQEHSIRYRSGANIAEELVMLKQLYDINGFCISDDNFIIDKNRIIDICDHIKPLNLKWSALSRVNTIDNEILKAIYNSGCVELKFGIESGSQRLLNLMNKHITIDQICNAVNLTNDFGIGIKAFIIHGFPGENIDSTKETINLLNKIGNKIDRISIFRFVPLPGSYVYENYEKFNLSLPNSFEDIYVYNNSRKWWGNNSEREELEESYNMLKNYVTEHWEKY